MKYNYEEVFIFFTYIKFISCVKSNDKQISKVILFKELNLNKNDLNYSNGLCQKTVD